jgi:hypothetical protein
LQAHRALAKAVKYRLQILYGFGGDLIGRCQQVVVFERTVLEPKCQDNLISDKLTMGKLPETLGLRARAMPPPGDQAPAGAPDRRRPSRALIQMAPAPKLG